MEKEERILNIAKENMLKEDTRKISIKEGCYASVMSGIGDAYITPFALALKSTNSQIGLLSALAGILGPLSQLSGSKLMEKFSRKKIIIISVALHALLWLPILSLGILAYYSLFSVVLPVILIIFYSIYVVAGSIAGPSWFSLLGDIVPESIRGRYFSKRNRICGAVALVSTLVASFFLDLTKTHGFLLLGFSLLFLIASISRMKSALLFKKHYEPKLKLENGYYFSLWQFIKKAPSNNFGRFVILTALVQLASNIAGPFFAVYMLKDLDFSLATFTLVNISGSLFTLIFLPMWGKFSDRYGNRETLKLGIIFISLVPLFWLFSDSPLFLMLVPQFFSGLGWAAFNLAVGNFIYDSVSIPRRGICVTYHNILVGVGVFIGAAIGGIIADNIHVSINIFLVLFIVSAILRALFGALMLPKVKEVRKVKTPKDNPLDYLTEIRPQNIIHLNFIKRFFWKPKR